MACNSCNQVVLPNSDDSVFPYTTTAMSVKGRPITSSMVDMHRPRGGWKLSFTINGQEMIVNGASARQSVALMENLFKLNGIGISKHNLWFNANIQWLENMPRKSLPVTAQDLLNVADANVSTTNTLPVSDWGKAAFATLNLYLQAENYSYEKFLFLAEEMRTWMNPVENRLMGSSDYYIKMSSRISNLRAIPLYSADEARVWLAETQKILGI